MALLPFYARDKECLKVLTFDVGKGGAPTDSTQAPFPLPAPKAALWSPNGQALAFVDAAQGVQVSVFHAENGDGNNGEGGEPCTLDGAPRTTQGFVWSPLSSALVTVAPAVKGSQEPNLHIWRRTGTGEYECQAAFCHPKVEKDKKVLQWTSDEAFCARLSPDGQVLLMEGSDLSTAPLVELKLALPAQSFEFAPLRARGNLKARLAVFVSDTRDDLQRVVGPAEVTIWEFVAGPGGALQATEKAKTAVASGQIAELMWNSTGSALLAHCQTEVDESGQSYYGGSKLVLISSDGEFQKDLTDSEAAGGVTSGTAVQAVAWSPTRDEFILIHGFQPAQATLFSWDERAKQVEKAKTLLEKAHRNTIRFNHFGSLVCLAGFGNLAGQVDFFGRVDENQCDFVRVSSCQANCTVFAEWAPDGRHFLTSVLFPRMRVDNGASIWHALSGTMVSGRDFEELYDTQWRPEPPDSLRFLDVSLEEVEAASKDLANKGSQEGGTQKKQAYRPPKARGEGASTVAAMMRGEVAAPDGDERRKRGARQPPRQREEDIQSSPRPDVPPWGEEHRERREQQLREREERLQRLEREEELEQPSPPQQYRPEPPPLPNVRQPPPAPERPQAQARNMQQAERQQAVQQPPQPPQPPRDPRRVALEDQQKQATALVAQHAAAAAQAAAARAGHPGHLGGMHPGVHSPGHPAHAGVGPGPGGYPSAAQQRAMAMAQQQAAQQAAQQQQQAYGRASAPGHQLQQVQPQRQAGLPAQQQRAQQQPASQAGLQAQQQRAQQQPASQGVQGHGTKLPCPRSGWQYVDPKQNIQGPFTLLEMQQWNSMGYFRPDLPMRCDPSDQFVPFQELFPHPLIPFQSYPKRPTRLNEHEGTLGRRVSTKG